MKKKSIIEISSFVVSRVLKLFLFLFLFTAFSNVYSQISKIRGVVKDAGGTSLQGASITVKGTTVATLTDSLGRYSLSVSNKQTAVLVFTSIGFSSKEETVNSRSSINVTLSSIASALDEVVVIGYGSQSKRNAVSAMSSVNSKQVQERQPVTLFDAIQGQAAGVLVTNDNGDPSGQGTIQIRGASTINSGNGPIYVIDGIINDNGNFVNPADIETINILKDASSTAIYGARGANGVIVITTKKGKEGSPTISATYLNVFGNLAHKIPTVSAAQLRLYRALRAGSSSGANPDSLNPYLNADNDFQNLLFKQSDKKIANLSIGGGQKGLNYYGSLNYTDDKSIIINSWMKRVQSKINISYQASPKLRISHSLSFAWQTGNDVPISTTVKSIFDRNPWTSIYKPDGTYSSYVESKKNPIASALFTVNTNNIYTIQFNTQAVYDFTKDLKLTTLFNAQLNDNASINFSPAWLTSGGTGNATGSNALNTKINWESQVYLNYTKTLGKHNFTALIGVSADRSRTNNYLLSMNGYVTEAILTSNAGILVTTAGKTATSATANVGASIFSRLIYSYMGKYILQGTWRKDGSSRFGDGNKWGNFYSGSTAWRFSDEKFMTWTKSFITDGKLRFSIGQAGNDRIGDYPFSTNLIFGSQIYNGVSVAAENTTLGNSTIKWETTTTANYGMDLTLLKGKITLTTDYYNKRTDNLLYNKKLPVETGKTDVTVNLGTIINTGFEFTLTTNPITTKNFSWDLIGNISFQRGHIKSLADHTSFISSSIWLIQEGGKIGDFYVWKNLGVYQYDVSNAYSKDGQRLTPVDVSSTGTTCSSYTLNGQKYTGTIHTISRNGIVLQGGDTEWKDINNDGVIDDNDKLIAGNGIPNYFFGITNNFRYKNFSLSFLFNGQIGNDVYNSVANGQNTNASTYSPPTVDAILSSWQKQGDISKYPLFSRKDARGGVSNGYNSLYIEDGSFIRLSSIRMTYYLDKNILNRFKMKGASIYIYGNNIATWTNYSWFDPEFTSSGLNIGQDGGNYPKRREIGFGANINL